MNRESTGRPRIGLTVADSVGRLVGQAATTAVLARLIAPEAFGTAALLLSLAGFLGVLVQAPFEEALAQRKVVQRAHLETAFLLTLAGAMGLSSLVVLTGVLLPTFLALPDLATCLAASMVIPVVRAPYGVAMGWARRKGCFNAIAISNSVGFLVGAGGAVALGVCGAEVWALLSFQIASAVVSTLLLYAFLGLAIRPRWSKQHFLELRWYAKHSLATRATENSGYLLFNYAVGCLFGLTALGFLNMAFRVIEPIRGAVASVTHNFAFSMLVSVRSQRAALASEVVRIAGLVALFVMPICFGLAAVVPVLIPLLAGPGWEPATEIADWMILGTAVVLPLIVVASALNASGQPQFDTRSTLIGVLTMLAVLPLAASIGIAAIGVARFSGDIVRALILLRSSNTNLGLRWRELLGSIFAASVAAVVMALVVVVVGWFAGATSRPSIVLALQVLTGVFVYAGCISLTAPERAKQILAMVLARAAPAVSK